MTENERKHMEEEREVETFQTHGGKEVLKEGWKGKSTELRKNMTKQPQKRTGGVGGRG